MIIGINKTAFIDMMDDERLFLPHRWENGDFQIALKKMYDIYLNKLPSVLNESDIKIVRRVCNLVLRSISHYYNGYPSNAFTTFSKVMDLLMERPFMIYQKSGEVIRMRDIDSLKLYRVRNVYENKVYERKDIFHTPFSLRSKVGTCRYSIAGYPCLYLATNLDLCVLETPKTESNQMTLASRFELVRHPEVNGYHDIKVIELGVKPQHFLGLKEFDKFTYDNDRTINRLNEINLKDEQVRMNYLIWYPVIAAASFIRICKSDPFASEYIVPQLILEWVRLSVKKDNEYYGIRYFSCASERASEIGMNYVFPTYYADNPESNYCDLLSRVFKLTKPLFMHNYYGEEYCQIELDRINAKWVFSK